MTGRAARPNSGLRGLVGPKAEKTISLALQGGGAHGAFTWGVLDALIEDGRLAIEAISGASAGAMNAVVLVEGWIEGGPEGAREQLRKFWKRVSLDGALSPVQQRNLERAWGCKVIDRTGPSSSTSSARGRARAKARCRSNWPISPTRRAGWSAPGPISSASAAASASSAGRARPRSRRIVGSFRSG